MKKFKFGDILISFPHKTTFIFKNYFMCDRIESLEGSNSIYLNSGNMDKLSIVGGCVRRANKSERKSYIQLFLNSPHNKLAEEKLLQYYSLKYKIIKNYK